MDISEFNTADDHEEGAKLSLVDRYGNIVDAYLIIKGPDSAAYRSAKRKQRKDVVELVEKGVDIHNYDFFPLDVEFACKLVCGWGEITENGEPLEFTPESCKALLSKAPIIVERVLDFCGDRENFIKG